MCFVAFVCLSDDELTPYDMSGDQEMSRASPPRYLRDCLEGRVLFIQTSTFSPDWLINSPVVIFAFLSSDMCSSNFLWGLSACGAQSKSCWGFGEEECLCRQRGKKPNRVVVSSLDVMTCSGAWYFYCSEIVPSLQFMLLCLYCRSASSWLKFFFTWRINTASMASWDSDRRRWWRWQSLILFLYDLKYLSASTSYFGFTQLFCLFF